MSHPCPTCAREFDSRRGLGVHHSVVHDERLLNRECAACGVGFYSEYAKKYCSEACRSSAVSFVGENNPNYSGTAETTSCDIRGDTFEYYPSQKPGEYCARCVETEGWRTVPRYRGEANSRWKGGKEERTCSVCSNPVRRHPSMFSGGAVLCSNSCRSTWLSETFTGEGHPNGKGGDVGPYGRGWAAIRRAALERDDHRCRLCGAGRQELGRNPDVHHIVPVREFLRIPVLTVADAHTLDNVVSLCVGCHRKADGGRVTRERLRQLACDCVSSTTSSLPLSQHTV